MSGEEKGKYEQYGEEAWELYVRENKTDAEIARILEERYGEAAPSAAAVGNWRKKWDWAADRAKHIDKSRSVADLAGRIVRIAEKIVAQIEKKIESGEELTSGDMDQLSKATKILQRLDDPGQDRRIAIDVITQYIDHLKNTVPHLVEELADPTREFLEKVGD